MPSQPPIARQLLDAYAIEGMALVGDGVPAADVEAAASRIGVAAGPLAAADQVSIGYFDEILHSAAGGHGHSHGQGHDHSHGHDHGQGHEHSHGHDHQHGHGHEHEHERKRQARGPGRLASRGSRRRGAATTSRAPP